MSISRDLTERNNQMPLLNFMVPPSCIILTNITSLILETYYGEGLWLGLGLDIKFIDRSQFFTNSIYVCTQKKSHSLAESCFYLL